MIGRSRHPALSRRFSATPSMTPLIDVVFLLIVFFMLVAQISRYRPAEMALARVGAGAADAEPRVVVEVLPGGGYMLDGAGFDGTADGVRAMSGALAAARAEGETSVRVRAARDEEYARVAPVLRALRDAGFSGAELAVRAGAGGGG